MSKSRVILVIAAVIALLPFLGFPHSWEAFFQVVGGLSIIGVSEWSRLDRELALKAKAHMRQMRKPVSPEAAPEGAEPKVPPVTDHFGKRSTDFYPKTGQVGRRLSDIKPQLVEGLERNEEQHGDEVV